MMLEWLGLGPKPQSYDLGQPLLERNGRGRQGLIVILVLGRTGVGKSHLIEAISTQDSNRPTLRLRPTLNIESHSAVVAGAKYELIDTPGFDNEGISDIEICANITKYLRKSSAARSGVHGIVYIHQACDPLRSKSIRKYLMVLSQVLLGNSGMRRLTILLPCDQPHSLGFTQVNEELQDPNAALSRARMMGARVWPVNEPLKGLVDIMGTYTQKDATFLPIQLDRPNIVPDLESILHEKLAQSRPSNQEDRIKKSYEQKLHDLHSVLDARENDLTEYRDALQRAENLQANLREAEASLHQQLRQMQREYSSLRSELQLQENFEQSDIVQELEDLNRQIDDISRSISVHLTDSHVLSMFGRDPAEVTSKDARNLPGLLKLLGANKGQYSLVLSPEGKGLQIESFLDFAIRHMLCTLLITAVFRPFHPGIDSDQSTALLRAYEDIQKRESQTNSGKWRSSTFKSICKLDEEQTGTSIRGLLHSFIYNISIKCSNSSKEHGSGTQS
ncbi:hypothetical protein RSOLAG1IB_04784 [Rhizoctonia solani AG-1 IB]|uniref:G domain-containing protein n=1 Tax=Thanatephorus cucumeris (strain AG1-IB / isolate 7/3/14) TaxID=1108050 RepID=A0A0B7G1Q7_THACB|nr:hypothetical protein RSOLAG1IB_04784 [Rhizoctonia solani AG-1 IB]